MKTLTRKPLYTDAYCRIYVDAEGVLHVAMEGSDFVPAPGAYEGFTGRDFSDLFAELTNSGIPAAVAGRWVNQAQGFDGV